jgi:hypothetical protein
MNSSELASMSLSDICELYKNGEFPPDLAHLTLSDIVELAKEEDIQKDVEVNQGGVENVREEREEPASDEAEEEASIQQNVEVNQGGLENDPEDLVHEPASDEAAVIHEQERKFWWKEKKPNSNNTNVPLLLWRGDENNSATLSLAFGLYDEEFNNIENEVLEIKVKSVDGQEKMEKIVVELDFPKDEKLARKSSGLAGSGSEYLCTYCSASRKTAMNPPHTGNAPVTLTNNMLREACHYCQLNPSKKSQAQLSKVSLGTKEMPLCSTEALQETPDTLHLDINVTKQLVTIACRLLHHKRTGQPLTYVKSDEDKKEMESSEALYHKKLRERIATLPELTQNPGNFAREYCKEENADFIKEPLPDINDTHVWSELMILWRLMRSVHKSNVDPTDEDVARFIHWAEKFQELFFSLKWVPAANQIHRLSHIAFFMQSRVFKSIGAFSLEGLEHGNFSAKDGEQRRIWKGDTKQGNLQLFRLLRFQSSPTLVKAMENIEMEKRKPMKCSKCGQLGHRRTSKKCSLFNDGTVDDEENEPVEGDDLQEELVFDDHEVDQSEDEDDETQDDNAADPVEEDSDDTDVTIINVDENNQCITS